MRIVYLLETAAELWGGVKSVLADANLLQARGHAVHVLAKSPPPGWMQLACGFTQVPDFAPERIPAADVVVGTFWTTVPFAARCRRGVPVHYRQGYEGDNPENAAQRSRIEEVYRLPVPKIVISPHLRELVAQRFGGDVHEVVYSVDHQVMRPAPERPCGRPVRVGLVGPWQIPWKDLRTGYQAAELAHRAGLPLQLVRVTNTAPHAEERAFTLPVEWHERVAPAQMGEIYRSLDVMLCTSSGPEEGFFMPAVEAMACGVPCVMTDIPCFRGYGDGQYAMFVPARQPAAMAEALVLAAGHAHVRAQLRSEGLRTAAAFTPERHVEAIERTFAALVAASERRGLLSSADLPNLEQSILVSLRTTAEGWLQQAAYARALACLEAATHLAPEDPALLHELGYVRYLAGDDAGALRAYDAALDRGAASRDLHAGRALILFARGDHQGARDAYQRALQIGPEDAELWNNLGVARHRSGDARGAADCFRQALALDPHCADARQNLSGCSG